MRKLNTSDVFAMARVVRASGMREELRGLIKRAAESGAKVEDVGIDGFLTILEALAEKKAESAIYEVLSGPFEVTVQEVSVMQLDELTEKLTQLAEGNDLKRFFKWLSGILGKN